jgi:hypothetical protein
MGHERVEVARLTKECSPEGRGSFSPRRADAFNQVIEIVGARLRRG